MSNVKKTEFDSYKSDDIGDEIQIDENNEIRKDVTNELEDKYKIDAFELSRKYFVKRPVISEMVERLPEKRIFSLRNLKLTGQMLKELYAYNRSLCHEYFRPEYQETFFPANFYKMCSKNSSYFSKVEHPDSFEEIENEPDFSEAFSILKSFYFTDPNICINFSDFCVSYPSLVISTCGASNIKHALSFAECLLTLKFVTGAELRILTKTLLFRSQFTSIFQSKMIDLLVTMVQKFPICNSYIEFYSTNTDKVGDICKDILSTAFQGVEINYFKGVSEFSSEEEVLENLIRYNELLARDIFPTSIEFILGNIISTWERFPYHQDIVMQCVSFIHALIDKYDEGKFKPEFVSSCLRRCFDIFLHEDDYDDGVFVVTCPLVDRIFQLNHDLLFSSLYSVVSLSNSVELKIVLEKLKEFIEGNKQISDSHLTLISDALAAFHPEREKPSFLPSPSCSAYAEIDIEESILRIIDPVTSLREINNIVKSSKDGNFVKYPHYIRPILTKAYRMSLNNM